LARSTKINSENDVIISWSLGEEIGRK